MVLATEMWAERAEDPASAKNWEGMAVGTVVETVAEAEREAKGALGVARAEMEGGMAKAASEAAMEGGVAEVDEAEDCEHKKARAL